MQGRDDGSEGGWKRIRLYRQSREGGHSEKRRGPIRLVTIYRSELGWTFSRSFCKRPIGRNIQWECFLLLLGALCAD